MKESDITTRVADLKFDPDHLRWPVEHLRRWLNDGQREIAMLRPEATARKFSMVLQPGALQRLPERAVLLLDVTRNLGDDGQTAGAAVRLCQMEELAAYLPNWSSANSATAIQHFMYDEREPLAFYVYPPVPASPPVAVEIMATWLPTDTGAPSDNLSIGDWYANALVDYILWRMECEDSEMGVQAPAAQAQRQMFESSMGVQSVKGISKSPNTANEGGKPPRGAP